MTRIKHDPSLIFLTASLLAIACGDDSSGGSGDDSSESESGSDSGEPMSTSSAGSASGSASGGSDDGDPGDGGSDDGAESSTGEVADVPPEIVSITPADGDAGVRADASFVITFSEPMNKAAAQQAWQSPDFPASIVTMSWNDAGDELTVTPNDPIVLGTGTDPEMVVAPEYTFTVTTVATDETGNELEAGATVTFTAARHITTSLTAIGKFTGSAGAAGDVELGFVAIGDTDIGEPVRGFASFEPTTLPDGILEIVTAELRLTVLDAFGTPYTDLGDLVLYDTSFLDWAGIFEAPMEDIGSMCMVDQVACTHDVTAQLAADYADDEDLSQYGIRFTVDNDLQGDFDWIVFHAAGEDAPRLDVEYLIE